MKKLYEVEIKVYVMAEDAEEAAQIAVTDCQDTEAEAFLANSVDSEWFDVIPYGGDDDTTCGEILKSQRAAQQSHPADVEERPAAGYASR